MNIKLFFHKLSNWEYWHMHLIYFPIYFQWAFYSIRTGSLFFFNASNPTIKNGGFIMESKKAIYNLIPSKFYPKTEIVLKNTPFETVEKYIKNAQINFPFIAKPDIGLRGSAVKKINNLEDLKSYSTKANFDYLVQNLIPFPNEIGIFFVRFPDQKTGKITGIVAKEFMIIEGNGTSTVVELIKQNPRFEMQLKVLKKEFGNKLNDILPKGEKFNLMPYGNHCRGSKFLDYSDKISDKLNAVINEISLQIPEFYFGRYDIMYHNWEDLENGKNFSIVELNGAASEPTHIYDPKHSLFFAWKTLASYIAMMYKISVINHKRGFPYLTYKNGMEQYKLHLNQNKKFTMFK
jgi:hypothetical protein